MSTTYAIVGGIAERLSSLCDYVAAWAHRKGKAANLRDINQHIGRKK